MTNPMPSDARRDHERSNHMAHRLGAAALQLCTITETCDLLGVSRWQVYQLINQNELRTVKIGRRRLVPLRELDGFVERRLRTAGGNP